MKRFTFALTGLLLSASFAIAQPATVAYQGFLSSGGSPVNGNQNFNFFLYTAALGGAQVWGEAQPSVPVVDGVYNVQLGSVATLAGVDFKQDLWLEVRVNGVPLTPRSPISGVPYALQLRVPAQLIGNSPDNHVFRVNNTATSGILPNAIYGQSLAPNGAGIFGKNFSDTGNAYGVFGQTGSTTGRAVFGQTLEPTGVSSGIYGLTGSNAGRGVFGEAFSSTGTTYGVRGESASTTGMGVFGQAKATSGVNAGVSGETNSTQGRGVLGKATTMTGLTIGVRGESASDTGTGVFGKATSAIGIGVGVSGEVTSENGYPGFFSGGVGVHVEGSDNAGADLILGANSNSSDDGRIFTDPAYASSDMWLHTNDAVVIRLDFDGDGEDADFSIRDKDNNTIFNVDEDGTVSVLGSTEHASDVNRKEAFQPVDVEAVLQGVAGLPMLRWRYKGQQVPHLGPMAQDFHAAFEVGKNETTISAVDADGVALAAIQALYARNQRLEQRLAELEHLVRTRADR